jgi:hypothetical protein
MTLNKPAVEILLIEIGAEIHFSNPQDREAIQHGLQFYNTGCKVTLCKANRVTR